MASISSFSDAKEKEQNYIRLNLLIVKLSTFVLKARFDHIVPPENLHHQLKKFNSKIKYGKNKKIISQKQFELLFPHNASPSSDKFDITLLVYLLRHICSFDGKCPWWIEKDNSNIPDTVEEEIADIVRIRNLRNEIQHLQKASVDQRDFEEKWDTAEKALLRLGAISNLTDLKSEIETVKNQPFETVEEKVIVIMQSHGFDDDFEYGDDDDDDDRYDDDYDDFGDYDEDMSTSDDMGHEDDDLDDLDNDNDDHHDFDDDDCDNCDDDHEDCGEDHDSEHDDVIDSNNSHSDCDDDNDDHVDDDDDNDDCIDDHDDHDDHDYDEDHEDIDYDSDGNDDSDEW